MLYQKPIHPYTEALLAAVPVPDPKASRARPLQEARLKGEVPSPIHPPAACRFHTRCPHATDICRKVEPPLVDYGNGHLAACHHPRNVTPTEIAAVQYSELSPKSAGRDALPSA